MQWHLYRVAFCPLISDRVRKCWFFWREEDRRTRKNTLGAKTRTNTKLSPHTKPGAAIEPGPHWLEARNKKTNGKSEKKKNESKAFVRAKNFGLGPCEFAWRYQHRALPTELTDQVYMSYEMNYYCLLWTMLSANNSLTFHSLTGELWLCYYFISR